jgi:hypothetical protein
MMVARGQVNGGGIVRGTIVVRDRAAAALLTGLPLALGVAVLLAVWFVERAANPGPLGFRLDDAWIHMVYGRGLWQNGYLAYNSGVPATGCTSPLWSVFLAVLHGLFGRGADPTALLRAVFTLGGLLHLVTIGFAADLARRLTESRFAGAGAGLLIALAVPQAAAAFSGMEVVLTSALLVAALHSLVAGAWARAGILFALCGLARPEAAVVTIVCVLLAERRAAVLGRLLLPSVIAGLALMLLYTWAGGSALPATYHAKASFAPAALLGRLGVALTKMLPQSPPFRAGVAWIVLLGLFVRRRGAPFLTLRLLPLLAGSAYLLANLVVLDPVDPAAFYHLRYLLPALPLLLVALAMGAHELGCWLRGRGSRVPLALLLLFTIVEAASAVRGESRHLHNDVRNINEVQRRLGEWLGETLPAGTWIAASDAGAIRYFSELPTIDVIGLNTPEVLEPDEDFLRSHPVAALAVMPAWFRPLESERLTVLRQARTDDYTVTSNPQMASQVIVGARAEAGGDPVKVRFRGYRDFALYFQPRAVSKVEADRGAP